jgi:tripartite ATP-independent transporter DctM subunit
MFSCLSGSSIGTTAMLGSIMIPDMEKRGYKPCISIGSCMCGALAMIIPPSALAVILAAIAGVSVGKVLIGGIVPGLLLAVLYIGYIVGRCIVQPSVAPMYTPEPVPLAEKLRVTVKYLLPLGTIVFAVVGLIFLGVATPTESAAMGSLATCILAVCYKRLNFEVLKKSLDGTLRITVMMYLIVTGSLGFSQILAYSGATSGFVQTVTDLPLPPLVLMIAMQFVILILGMFMEQVSIMLITLPIFMPMVSALGFNEIWFALIMLVNLEVAMESPPFGFLLFVMKGVVPPHITMATVYKSTLPFIIIDVSVIILMLLFPELVIWLPEHAM